MADNVNVTPGTGATLAADDIAGVLTPRVKVQWGPDGTVNDTDVATGKPLPVQLRTATGTATPLPALGTAGTASADVITIQGIASGTVVPISVASLPSQAVTNIGTFAVQTTTVPADPFGVNADAASATGSISAKLRFIAATGIPITGTVTVGSHAVTNAGTFLVQENGAAATSLALLDDTITAQGTALGSTKTGLQGGSVTTAAPTYTTGQISPLSLDTAGALRVTGAGGGTQYTEDVAAAADPVGNALVAVRRDTLVTNEVSADGDNIALKATNKGQLHVLAAIDTTQLTALSTTAQPRSTGFQLTDQPTDGTLITKGLSNKAFGVTFATLTRPANTTAYTAADSISDNATAGSVTALVSGNISDTNDDPIFISEIHVNSTDTGLAGKKIRAYLFNANPTTSSGVVAGDNVAYSQKKAGYLGSFMGYLETGFSDGTVGRLVPCYNETNFTQAGGFVVVPPVSGARTLYIQYQAVEAFTPSANSTTIIGTARGWQGRAN